MNTKLILPLLTLGLSQLVWPAQAQNITSGVPGFVSYQGRVLDSTGALVGTGTPVNRTVIFRVWDHASNISEANLIYSEEQTVTISEGKFSVLVGQGVATTTSQFQFSETAKGPPASIADAFNGELRYLGVTVDDGSPAVDNEIAPRQQIVTSAFAFRSKYAETLGTSTSTAMTVLDSGNVGVGNTSPPARFTITGANTSTSTSTPQLVVTADADNVTERLRIGVDSTGNGTSFLQSWKEGTGATRLLLNPNGGNVGIGNAAPGAQLQVGSPSFTFASPTFQVGGGALGGTVGDTNVLGSFNVLPSGGNQSSLAIKAMKVTTQGGWPGTAMGLTYDVDGVGPVGGQIWMHNGNVGIGMATPQLKLEVRGGNSTGMRVWDDTNARGVTLTSNQGGNAPAIVWYNGAKNWQIYQTPDHLGFYNSDNVYPMALYNDGTVNIPGSFSAGGGGSRFRGVQRETNIGGCYIEWGNQAPGTYGQSYILNQKEGGNPGIFLGEVSTTHAITESLFTSPGETRVNGHIYAWSFQATSDERIKSVVGRSSAKTDLDTVRKLRVTDYHFTDQDRGKELQKGFIAQEVKEVIPEAVKKTGAAFVPDIYADAKGMEFDKDTNSVTIQMEKAHNLKAGDKVRIMADEERHDLEVAAVEGDRAFVVGPIPGKPAKMFVYGKQVDDLLAVDYNRLFTTGIGAIQELADQVDAVTAENAALRTQLAASEQRLAEMDAAGKARDVRLAAIEKLLAAGTPATRTVSLQTATE